MSQNESQAKLNADQSKGVNQYANSSVTTEGSDSTTIQTNNGFTVNNIKDAIAQSESGGSYTAQNGRYYGKYQLDISYLNGDLSPANQEATFDRYITSRYGSLEAAWAHWEAYHWY